MPRGRQPPHKTWRTFLTNNLNEIASVDLFTVPTATFRVLFGLVVLCHYRRQVLHFNVTEHPDIRFIPIITATISIVGFLWGVRIYIAQQESDRKTRLADQISRDLNRYRTSKDELLQFSSNQNMTVARVLALRQDLDGLIDSLYPITGDNQRQKERLKTSIYDLISKDFDFTQTRQVQFDMAALQNWVDYKKGLEGNLNYSITEKYLKALGDLRYKNPGVLEGIRVNEGDDYQDPETVIGEPYRSVIEGFVCHFSLLPKDQKIWAQTKFGNVIYNKTLAADLSIFKCPVGVLPLTNVPN